MADKILTLDQAAKSLGISRGALLKTIKCGKIPARYGRRGMLLVRESDLLPFTHPLSEWDDRKAS